MLIYPSDLVTHAKEDAKHLHINGMDNPQVNFASLVKETNERIGKDSESIGLFYDEHENITLYRGTAKFVNSTTIEIN